jgi:hypothetical protein
LSKKDFEKVILNVDKLKTVFVATFSATISQLEGIRTFAIVMNEDSWEEATDIDYFITNFDRAIVTNEWIVTPYSQRNWVEVFYREANGSARIVVLPKILSFNPCKNSVRVRVIYCWRYSGLWSFSSSFISRLLVNTCQSIKSLILPSFKTKFKRGSS